MVRRRMVCSSVAIILFATWCWKSACWYWMLPFVVIPSSTPAGKTQNKAMQKQAQQIKSSSIVGRDEGNLQILYFLAKQLNGHGRIDFSTATIITKKTGNQGWGHLDFTPPRSQCGNRGRSKGLRLHPNSLPTTPPTWPINPVIRVTCVKSIGRKHKPKCKRRKSNKQQARQSCHSRSLRKPSPKSQPSRHIGHPVGMSQLYVWPVDPSFVVFYRVYQWVYHQLAVSQFLVVLETLAQKSSKIFETHV